MARQGESSIVAKCALIIDVLSEARRPLAFSDIIQRTGLVKSSGHRVLAVLKSERLVEYDEVNRTYSAGSRISGWARATWRRSDLQAAASHLMADLSETTRMNVALSILDANTVLYLRTVNFFSYRFASHAGDHAPLHATAAGKLFLANMKPRRQQETVSALKLDKYTENTKTSLEELTAQFSDIRAQGFATAIGEESLQVTGMAAPIAGGEDEIVAALSIWSISDHHRTADVLAQAPRLIEIATQISEKTQV